MKTIITFLSIFFLPLIFVFNINAQPPGWESLAVPMGAKINSVAEDSSGIIFISTKTGIFKSADTCRSWQKVTNPFYGPVSLFVLNNGDLVGTSNNITLATSDKGISWYDLDTTNNFNMEEPRLNPVDGLFYCVDFNTVYRYNTNDRKFEVSCKFKDENVYDYFDIDKNGNFYACSKYGGVIFSSDKGVSWLSLGRDTLDINSMIVSGSGTIVTTGNFDGIYVSSDLGENWLMYDYPPSDPFYNVKTLVKGLNGEIYCRNSLGIYSSRDDCKSWTRINNGPDSYYYYSSVFPGRSGKLFGTGNSSLFIVIPSKESWAQKNPSLEPLPVTSVFISENDVLFAASSLSGVYRSSDSCKSWTNVLSAFSLSEKNVSMIGTNRQKIIARFDNKYYISHDYGLKWNLIPLNIPDTNFTRPRLCLDSSGVLHAIHSITNPVTYSYQSHDYGQTWVRTPWPGIDNITDIQFGKYITVVLRYHSEIYVSEDNGWSWISSLKADYSKFEYFDKISVSPKEEIYFLKNDYYLLRSKDHGLSWRDLREIMPERTLVNNKFLSGFTDKGEFYSTFITHDLGTENYPISANNGIYRNARDTLFYRVYNDQFDTRRFDAANTMSLNNNYIFIHTYKDYLLRMKLPNDIPELKIEAWPDTLVKADWYDTLAYKITVRDMKNIPIRDSHVYAINLYQDSRHLEASLDGTCDYKYYIPGRTTEGLHTINFINDNPDYVCFNHSVKRQYLINPGQLYLFRIFVKDNNYSQIPDTIHLKRSDTTLLTFVVWAYDIDGYDVDSARVVISDSLSGSVSDTITYYDGRYTYSYTYNGNRPSGIYPVIIKVSKTGYAGYPPIIKYISLDEETSASDNQTSGGINIWPNPACNYCRVSTYNHGRVESTVELYNSIGVRLFRRSIVPGLESSEITIDLEAYASGTYYVKAVCGRDTFVMPLLICR